MGGEGGVHVRRPADARAVFERRGAGAHPRPCIDDSGRIAEAATELSALHTAQPAERQVTLLLGDCWPRQGLDAKVIELLKPIDAEDPNDLAAAYLLGTA